MRPRTPRRDENKLTASDGRCDVNEHCWMTIPKFCKLMDISRTTFYRWCEMGVIPPEAVSREKGRWPRVDYARAFPEGYAVMKEVMER